MLAIDAGTWAIRAIEVAAQGARRLSWDGDDELPAAVAFAEPGADGQPRVGAVARRLAVPSPAGVATGIKRVLGLPHDDPLVRALGPRLLYHLVGTGSGGTHLDIGGQLFAPEEAIGRLFAHVANSAASASAVVSVPSCFDCQQRRALCEAAEIGGLSVVRLVSEPLAAAIGRIDSDGVYLVCDVGAGVADMAVVERRGRLWKVLGASADPSLGGDDMDVAIARELAAERGDDALLFGDRQAVARLCNAVREMRESWQGESASIELRMLTEGSGGAVDLARTITRADLGRWQAAVLRRLELPCQDALASSGVSARDVEGVLVCGGLAAQASVIAALKGIVGAEVTPCREPRSAVVDGLALVAAGLESSEEPMVMVETTGGTIGISDGSLYSPVIGRGARLPEREHKLIASREPEKDHLDFDLYVGESSQPGHNRLLGHYRVVDLPPRPVGEVVVVVECSLDESGMLELDARDLATGQPLEIHRLRGPGLTRAEVLAISERMYS